MGIQDLEESWDAYIESLEADGLHECEEEAQEIYDSIK